MAEPKQSTPTNTAVAADKELAKLIQEADLAEVKARLSEANARREEAITRNVSAKLDRIKIERELEILTKTK